MSVLLALWLLVHHTLGILGLAGLAASTCQLSSFLPIYDSFDLNRYRTASGVGRHNMVPLFRTVCPATFLIKRHSNQIFPKPMLSSLRLCRHNLFNRFHVDGQWTFVVCGSFGHFY
jgi:hypothetical protein